MPVASARPGLVDTVRRLAAGVVKAAEDRVELFALELHEEKWRLVQTMVLVSAGVVAGTLALVFASLTVVCLFWASARLAVLTAFAGLYGAAFAAIVLACRRFTTRQATPLAALRQELARDRECIRPQH